VVVQDDYVKMSYNVFLNELIFEVTMTPGSWVGLGFGDSMGSKNSPVDMV